MEGVHDTLRGGEKRGGGKCEREHDESAQLDGGNGEEGKQKRDEVKGVDDCQDGGIGFSGLEKGSNHIYRSRR